MSVTLLVGPQRVQPAVLAPCSIVAPSDRQCPRWCPVSRPSWLQPSMMAVAPDVHPNDVYTVIETAPLKLEHLNAERAPCYDASSESGSVVWAGCETHAATAAPREHDRGPQPRIRYCTVNDAA